MFAQTPAPFSARSYFEQTCATCHGNPALERAPARSVLRTLTPEAIYATLATEVMSTQAKDLTDLRRQALAECLADRKLGIAESAGPKTMTNAGRSNPLIYLSASRCCTFRAA